MCGGDSRECQDPANQRAYDVALARCYRTKAVAKATANRNDSDTDSRALVASTIHHPERVKPKN